MPAVLLSLADVKSFIGNVPASDDAVLQSILDSVEDLFLAECNRRERPFLATADTSNRTEVHDGTGTRFLTLHYPISTVQANITLGRSTSDPDETLDYTDVDVLVYVAGKRTIERTDGGIWGAADTPRYVHVTYRAQADKPEGPKLAFKRVCASVYRQRGSEDVSSESLGGFYSRDLADVANSDPVWRAAVASEKGYRI